MPTPETNLRIFVRPSMEEIVFPDNSATFVDYQLEQIDEGVQLVRDVNGNLRDLSNPAFRKYRLTLSATDNWLPALGNLWAGDTVDVELPEAIAERGATPSRTAVAGTVVVSAGYVRYRPRLTMKIIKAPSLSGVEFRGKAAGWTIELEEANGATDVPESSERLILAPRPMESAAQGTALSVNYAAELTKIPSGQFVTWSVSLGSLPPGLSLNAATGVVSGTPSAGGAYAFALRASGAAGVFAEQTYVFDVAGLGLAGIGGTQVDFTLAGKNLRSATFLGAGVFEVTRAGYLEDGWVIGGAGGGAKHTSTSVAAGGGSCGQVRRLRNPDGSRIWLNVGIYAIEVGAGGPASTSASKGGNGSQSSAFGIVSLGGGGGGTATSAPGPGGGGGGTTSSTAHAGGGPFGNVIGTLENGHRGGAGRISTSAPRAGGGAGAGEPGHDGTPPVGAALASEFFNGEGGAGIQIFCRTGLAEWLAGGGGGGVGSGLALPAGGLGGGGNGGGVSGSNATSGAANTGSGGGGASTGNAGNGGSGIVIVCWEP